MKFEVGDLVELTRSKRQYVVSVVYEDTIQLDDLNDKNTFVIISNIHSSQLKLVTKNYIKKELKKLLDE